MLGHTSKDHRSGSFPNLAHTPGHAGRALAWPCPALNSDEDSQCMGGTPRVKGLSFTEIFGVEHRASFLHRALGKRKHYKHAALSSGSRAEHCSGVTEQSLSVLFSMHSLQGRRQQVPHPHLPPPPPLPVRCLWARFNSQHRTSSPKSHHLAFSTAGQRQAKFACQN